MATISPRFRGASRHDQDVAQKGSRIEYVVVENGSRKVVVKPFGRWSIPQAMAEMPSGTISFRFLKGKGERISDRSFWCYPDGEILDRSDMEQIMLRPRSRLARQLKGCRRDGRVVMTAQGTFVPYEEGDTVLTNLRREGLKSSDDI